MGANPNVQDKKGRTPIMLAAEVGNDAIVALLAKNNANLKLRDAEGKGERKQASLFALERVETAGSGEKVGQRYRTWRSLMMESHKCGFLK